MGPRLEVGFRVAAGWRLFTEPRRWPLGRAKPLLKSSLSPAAAGAAMGVDFPLGDEGVSFDVVLDRLQARFPLGADSAPLSASSSTLVRTAERSPSRALTRAPTRPSIQEVARVPASAITCCATSVAGSRRPLASLSLRSRGARGSPPPIAEAAATCPRPLSHLWIPPPAPSFHETPLEQVLPGRLGHQE